MGTQFFRAEQLGSIRCYRRSLLGAMTRTLQWVGVLCPWQGIAVVRLNSDIRNELSPPGLTFTDLSLKSCWPRAHSEKFPDNSCKYMVCQILGKKQSQIVETQFLSHTCSSEPLWKEVLSVLSMNLAIMNQL